MSLRKEIKEAEIIPIFHGVAYIDYQRFMYIVYPFPVFLLVRWWLRFWYWVQFPSIGNNAEERSKIYMEGYWAGVKESAGQALEAKGKSYREGWEAAFAHLEKMVAERFRGSSTVERSAVNGKVVGASPAPGAKL